MDIIRIFIRIIAFLLTAQGLLCLRDVHVVVPDSVERNSKVEMRCLFDIEKDELYVIKWYRGDREFYRYSPREVPPLRIFNIPGIDVVKAETNGERLTIIPRSAQVAEGFYTCEVSADAPSFATAQVHTHMYVVDLPKSGPTMHGLRHRYRPGMKLKVECISRDSMPAANLSFFINNEPVLLKELVKERERCIENKNSDSNNNQKSITPKKMPGWIYNIRGGTPSIISDAKADDINSWLPYEFTSDTNELALTASQFGTYGRF